MLAFKMAAATLLLALALNGCAAENDKHGHPQLGFYQAPGGNNCPRGDEIFTQADCQAAAKQLVHTFAKPVNDIKGRPHGCFWDKVGGVYFNKAKCCYKGGWGGVGGMCKRQGPPLEAAGEMVSKPGDKYSTKGGGASFDNTIWITQTLAKSRADLFYPGDGKKCPIGLGIWLHKEYDGSEDLAGPFVVKACNMNDAGLYSVTFTQVPKFPGNSDRHRLDFKVKDWIYLRSKDGKPASTMAPRTSIATTTLKNIDFGPNEPMYTMFRIRAKTSASNWAWDVARLFFYDDADRRIPFLNAITSGAASPSHAAINALSGVGVWGGRKDKDGSFWIGISRLKGSTLGKVMLVQPAEAHAVHGKNDGIIVEGMKVGSQQWTEIAVHKVDDKQRTAITIVIKDTITTTTTTTLPTTTTTTTSTTTTPTSTSTTTSTGVRCGAGEYVDVGRNMCKACTLGATYMDKTSHTETKCMAVQVCEGDQFSNAGEDDATVSKDRVCRTHSSCAADQYVATAGTGVADTLCAKITTCAAGKYVETKAKPGLLGAKGSARSGSDAVCTRCESKTFTDEENAEKCRDLKTCGEDEFVSTPGTRSSDRECSRCADGTYQTAKAHSEQACMTTTTTSSTSSTSTSASTVTTSTTSVASDDDDVSSMADDDDVAGSMTKAEQATKAKEAETKLETIQEKLDALGDSAADKAKAKVLEGRKKLAVAAVDKFKGVVAVADDDDDDDDDSVGLNYGDDDMEKNKVLVALKKKNDKKNAKKGENGEGDARGSSKGKTADSGASTGEDEEESDNESNTTILVAVVCALLVVVAVVVAAVLYVKSASGSKAQPASFENPMYDSTGQTPQQQGSSVNSAYPAQQEGAYGEPFNEGAYAEPAAPATSGYMDVKPSGAANTGYMDVAPNGGANDDDGEDV